jgi:hypothetical protein
MLLLVSCLAYISTLKMEALPELHSDTPQKTLLLILSVILYVYLTASFCLFKVRTCSYSCPWIQLDSQWTTPQHFAGLQTVAQVTPVSYIELRFQDLASVTIKNIIFCDVTPCSLIEVYRRFGIAYCLHFRGRSVSQASEQASIRHSAASLPAFLLDP